MFERKAKQNVLKNIGREARDWQAEELASENKPAVAVAVKMPAEEGEMHEGMPEAPEKEESLEELLQKVMQEHPELLEKLMAEMQPKAEEMKLSDS